MNNQLHIRAVLGEDVDLLTKPDAWLQRKEESLHQSIQLLLEDLRVVQRAAQIKRQLQQKNNVAVRHYEWDRGRPVDEVIRVMPLPDAIRVIQRSRPNAEQARQPYYWHLDGYDVETAEHLRAS